MGLSTNIFQVIIFPDFCFLLFSLLFFQSCGVLVTTVFLNMLREFVSTLPMSKVLSMFSSFRVKCMKSTRTTIMAVCSLCRACCPQQHLVMQVSTSPDMRSRALVGSLSLTWDFSFHNCKLSHRGINIWVHFFRSSMGKYVQFSSSWWHHLVWLALLSNPSWHFDLFPYCLVHQERLPRYERAY